MFKIYSILILVLISPFVQAEKVQLEGMGGFKIYGDYLESKEKSNAGVLMLHQCNADRSMYSKLAQRLANNGISSMSLDFRGFGESVTDEVSIKALRAKATSRENYFEMIEKLELGKNRANDVQLAYDYLVGQLAEGAKISYIGASCGGVQAVHLAQKHKPASFVFFSSGMDEAVVSLFNKVSDVPALIIAAEEDEFTFKSSNKIFNDAKSKESRLLSYKGNGHGIPLFTQDPNLETLMLEWFKQYGQ